MDRCIVMITSKLKVIDIARLFLYGMLLHGRVYYLQELLRVAIPSLRHY